ncbi:MAG: conjugal transfer protein, partial [Peptoniphilus duerdenii]|nr:conjugal transfer protein [Peptoniphilus duerdenii]
EILKEISILNSNLQIIYENYKKKNISKEDYLKEKTFIQDKKILLESKLEELKSEKIDPRKETDITVLDEESLLKAYLDNKIDKIIVSRSGEIEIVEI